MTLSSVVRTSFLPLLAGALALGLSACPGTGEATDAKPETASPPEAPPASPHTPPPPTFKRSRTMMGTIISITVVGAPEAKAASAVDAAFREMEGLERILSEWLPDSDISRINAAAGSGTPVKVGPHTLTVIKAGLEVSRWSEGAFDLSWAAMRGLYQFQPGDERVPSDAEITERLKHVDYRKVVVDEAASTVALEQTGMALGTGGIAKGYALDRAAQVLREAGISSFMLFGGGQVQVHGMKGDRPWRVGIQHPRKADYFGFVEATGGSIATSGDYEHAFIKDGKRWHHIIDPATGRPVPHTASVTVVADSGLYADALSTAIFVLGAERAMVRLASAPGNPRIAVVSADMSLHVSNNLKDRLSMTVQLEDGRLPL